MSVALNQRVDDLRDLMRVELRRVEEVCAVRLNAMRADLVAAHDRVAALEAQLEALMKERR